MIRHCVFIRFKNEITAEHKLQLFGKIDALNHRLDGVLDVHSGSNVSPKMGMDKGFSDGFIVDFNSTQSRDCYLEDAEHQAVGAQLVDAAEGGADGILVYDLEMPDYEIF